MSRALRSRWALPAAIAGLVGLAGLATLSTPAPAGRNIVSAAQCWAFEQSDASRRLVEQALFDAVRSDRRFTLQLSGMHARILHLPTQLLFFLPDAGTVGEQELSVLAVFRPDHPGFGPVLERLLADIALAAPTGWKACAEYAGHLVPREIG